MERAEWLKHMRSVTEAVYDQIAPKYWVSYGFYENAAHQEYLSKFLARVQPGGRILSAACGAGRYDGMLVEAGHSVLGLDQSTGMLRIAREHYPVEQYPNLMYEKAGLQELAQDPARLGAFDGAICMDALEHICPEDWPGILQGVAQVLKPGGQFYFTSEIPDVPEVEASYQRAQAMGLPVVYGELADGVEDSYQRLQAGTSEESDSAVYHFYPSLDQVRAWLAQAGLRVEEQGAGSGYNHIIARKT